MVGLGLMIVSGILRTRMEPVANLWTTNAAYCRPICFDDNYKKSTDELNPIRGVFEGIISRYKISTSSEHINITEQVSGA